MRLLVLGVNGFIGHALVRAVLRRTDWTVAGMDLAANKLDHSLGDPRFEFTEGDITRERAWVDAEIARADVVLPLAAIATPADYVRRPLDVFELTFEENLRIVRRAAAAGTRLVFPSTSEVYGLCPDEAFSEHTSTLVYGPIERPRWIYACSKQLLDRVIWALGRDRGLEFTLFRPFNWIGPRLDDPRAAREGSSRVVTQFITDLVAGRPVRLVDGGGQRRCFTWIEDGIDCLLRILDDPAGRASGEIINIGNPANECTMRDLAVRLARLHAELCGPTAAGPPMIGVPAEVHYGPGYQDMPARRPDVSLAGRLLGWRPRVGLDDALRMTFEAWLADRATSARTGDAACRAVPAR